MATVNKDITGTSGDDKITVSKKGYTFVEGFSGDDKYVVNNISNSFVELEDFSGNDTLAINNVQANDLTFFFDFPASLSANEETDDILYIVKKSSINSVLNQYNKFVEIIYDYCEKYGDKYNEEELLYRAYNAALKFIPQSGAISIANFTGYNNNCTLNDMGTNVVWQDSTLWGAGQIETITTVDTKNGVTKTLDIQTYFEEVRTKVETFLKEHPQYESASNVLFGNNNQDREALISIYKNTAINLTIEGNSKNNTITAENGVDTIIIKPNSGKDIIVGANYKDQLVFKTFDTLNDETLVDLDFENLAFEKVGNNFVIKNTLDGTSATLKDYFKQNQDNALNTINGTNILEQEIMVEQTASGKIYGSQFDDIIYGSNKNDTIYGSGGADDVFAGAGNDVIYTSEQGSVVDGGAGNDKIYVKEITPFYSEEVGGDVVPENEIIFGKGSGNDTIYGGVATDYIQMDGYTRDELTFTKSGNNLVIKGTYQEPSKDKMVTKSDSLTLVDWFKSNNRIDSIVFSNEMEEPMKFGSNDNYITVEGTKKKDTINLLDNSNVEINPGKGDDVVNIGGKGHKIFNINIGDGNKTISLSENFKGTLSLNFESDKLYELSYNKSADGNDLILAQNYDPDNCTHSPEKVQFITIENFYRYNFDESDKILFNYKHYSGWEYYGSTFEGFRTHACVSYFGKTNANNIFEIKPPVDDAFIGMPLIYGGNKNDIIDTTALPVDGTFIVTGEKGTTDIKTGEWSENIVVSNVNDTYTHISNLGGGNDVLDLYGIKKGDGITVMFDVSIDGSTQNIEKDIVFITSSGVKNFIKKPQASGVQIENWFGANGDDGVGRFEHFYVNDAVAYIDEHIEFMESRVRAWLNNPEKNKKGHQTAMDVFKYGTSSEKNSLLSVYTTQNLGLGLYDEDTLTLNGSNGNDVLYARPEMTVNGGKGNDKLIADVSEEVMYWPHSPEYYMNGGDGNDVLISGNYAIMNAGKGTNVVNADGASAFEHGGASYILEQGGGSDYIHFSKASIGDLIFEKWGDDLSIYNSSDENHFYLQVIDYFKNPAKSSLKGAAFSDMEIDYENKTAAEIVSAVKSNSISITELLKQSENGLEIKWPPVNSHIIKGSDIVGVVDNLYNSSGFNETFYGYKGENHLDLYNGAGNDTINSGKGQDYLHFVDIHPETEEEKAITLSDLKLSRHGNNLIIRYTEDDSITIANYYKLKGKTSIKGVEIDGITYSLNELIQDAQFCENKTLKGINSTEEMSDSLAGNDTIYGDSSDNSLFGYAGNDTIYTGAGNDLVVGGKGNDTLNGQGGENTYRFVSGDGNDTIIAGKKDVTILDFSQDSSIKFDNSGVSSTVPNEFGETNGFRAYYKSGNDLIIKYGINTDCDSSVTIKNFFKTNTKFYLRDCMGGEDIDLRNVEIVVNEIGKKVTGTSQDDYLNYYSGHGEMMDIDNHIEYYNNPNRTISTGAGNDTICIGEGYREPGSSTINAGAGDDNIYISGGNHKIYGEGDTNRIYINAPEMDQTTTIYAGKDGTDILILENIAFEDVRFSRSGNNLVISASYDGIYDEYGELIEEKAYTNKIVLADYFKVNHSVNELQTATGTYYLLELENLLDPIIADPNKKASITGTVLKDVIHGTVFNDTIKGGANDDALYGHQGNDKLYGETGVNKIYFSSGDGDDTIYMGKGIDEIHFDETVGMDTLNYRANGNNLVIYYGEADENNKQSSITISNYFSSSYKSVKMMVFDAISFTEIELDNFITNSVPDSFIDKATGKIYASNLYVGEDYEGHSDFIYTNSSSNKIVDEVYALGGNDLIQTNSKWAELNGGIGDDTYVVNSLSNVTGINDEGGCDTIVLNSKRSDVNILFNVYKEGREPEDMDDIEDNGLFIMSDKSLDKLVKSKMKSDVPNVSIHDYFNRPEYSEYENSIETIVTKDGYSISYADIAAVRQAVAGWVENSRFDSAMEALARGKSGEVKELLAIYESVWQNPAGVQDEPII